MPSNAVRTPETMRLPFSPSSVSVARHRLKSWMADLGGSHEAIEDARVVISELVANSVRHAQPLADGHILVALSPEDDAVQVSVTDGGGGTRPRNVHASTSALAGRGMAIVEVLSEKWWTERSGSRSTVHALLKK